MKNHCTQEVTHRKSCDFLQILGALGYKYIVTHTALHAYYCDLFLNSYRFYNLSILLVQGKENNIPIVKYYKNKQKKTASLKVVRKNNSTLLHSVSYVNNNNQARVNIG